MTFAVFKGRALLADRLPDVRSVDEAIAAGRTSEARGGFRVQRSDGATMVHAGEQLVTESDWRGEFLRRYRPASFSGSVRS